MSALPADLLPRPGRRSALLWLIAAVAFLMTLAAAATLALGRTADRIAEAAAGRITVSIAEADPARREAAARRVLAILQEKAIVTQATRLDEAEVKRLVGPYIGDVETALPALIDADLRPGASVEAVRAAVRPVASARVDAEGATLSPLLGLIIALRRLAIAILLLAAGVAVLVTMLISRAALAAHAGTIETLHGLGATDVQLARLVERRTALDAVAGGALGLPPAIGVIALVSSELGALNGGTVAVHLPLADWGLLALLPLFLALAALLATRLTILGQLRQAI